MTEGRIAELLEIERECVLRDSCRDCDRKYGDCVLVRNGGELYEMYTNVIDRMKPVKPGKEYSGSGTTWWNVCGACKTAINPNAKFCSQCGKPVDWT